MTTAQIIFAQLGGNRAVAMLGITNALDCGDALSFRFKGSRAANYCKVTLEPSDTYSVRFCRIGRGGSVAGDQTFEGIYAEDLRALFTRTTGLATSL